MKNKFLNFLITGTGLFWIGVLFITCPAIIAILILRDGVLLNIFQIIWYPIAIFIYLHKVDMVYDYLLKFIDTSYKK